MTAHADLLFRRLLTFSFLAGPALLLASTIAFVSGVGLIEPGITSWVEGILGSYGIAFFVPAYLSLAHRLAATHPRLGTMAAFTGLFGATAGFAMEYTRVLEYGHRLQGGEGAVWQAFYQAPGWEYLSVALLGPLFPLTSLLLGIGFWRAGSQPRWVAASLVAAGIGFPLAQVAGLDWALTVTYPGACLLWLLSFGWIARRGEPLGASGAGSRRDRPAPSVA